LCWDAPPRARLGAAAAARRSPADRACRRPMLRRFPIRAGRNDDKWCASSYPIDRLALADVRKGIEGLQQTFHKHKAGVEAAAGNRAAQAAGQKLLEDAHNKSMQNSITHLGHRIAAMESAQHVTDQNAIADLEKRLNAAAQLAASLPSWMIRGS